MAVPKKKSAPVQDSNQADQPTAKDEPACRDYNPEDDNFATATYVAQLRVGNASDIGGAWELALNGVYGHITWEQDGNGYLSSGGIPVELIVENGVIESSASWAVDNRPVLSKLMSPYTRITKVGIRVEALKPLGSGSYGPVTIQWNAYNVTYYDAMDEATPIELTCEPPFAELIPIAAAKKGTPGTIVPLTRKPIVIVPAPDNNQTRVEISGEVELVSSDPDRRFPPDLGASQMISKVYVWTT